MSEPTIVNNGFSNLVQTPGLFFCIVVRGGWDRPSFGVYMRHGSPGGAFWKNSEPLREFNQIGAANSFLDTLAGVIGASNQFPTYFE